MQIAIVGLGPWGLCALQCIVAQARQAGAGPLTLHIVEPSTPGVGSYELSLPDFLVMNNACAEIALPPLHDAAAGPPAGLYEWAVGQGYRWRGRSCTSDAAGTPIQREDFLPRRLMGEYLHGYYRQLLQLCPEGVEVKLHRSTVLDIVAQGNGAELLMLADGTQLRVGQVILTLGTAGNLPQSSPVEDVQWLAPYPASAYLAAVTPAARVAVGGMGLVATDVVMTLSEGLGGSFDAVDGRTVYRPSGREPTIYLVSRTGLPFYPKSTAPSQVPDRAQAFVLTPARIDRLLSRGRAGIDFAADVLPLLLREMSARYYLQALVGQSGAAESRRWAERLRACPGLADFDGLIERLAQQFGAFDPAMLFYGERIGAATDVEFERRVYAAVVSQLQPRSTQGPIHAACETFRALRDAVRTMVEHGRLSLDSYRDFHHRLRGNINRLVSGPPAWRLQQLLALMDAGILRIPFGPEPRIQAVPQSGRYRISSTQLFQPRTQEIDLLVRGYLDEPRLGATASPLLAALHRRGRLNPCRYGDCEVGSVDITADGNPLDRDGRVQSRLWIFGAVTEGTLFATHYIPSPSRGARAYRDIDRCVAAIFATARTGAQRHTALLQA